MTATTDSKDYSNISTVTRGSMASTIEAPPEEKLILSCHESKGLASVCAVQSAASTSHSSTHQAQDLRYHMWTKIL